MVAYSFMPSFVRPIEAGVKRQTIRLPRKRHARLGEPVQLYSEMRTRRCRKIIFDPLCIGVDEVRIELGQLDKDRPITEQDLEDVLTVNGIPVIGEAADIYAIGDGFSELRLGGCEPIRPFQHMCRWWLLVHGRRVFHGFAIRWAPRP